MSSAIELLRKYLDTYMLDKAAWEELGALYLQVHDQYIGSLFKTSKCTCLMHSMCCSKSFYSTHFICSLPIYFCSVHRSQLHPFQVGMPPCMLHRSTICSMLHESTHVRLALCQLECVRHSSPVDYGCQPMCRRASTSKQHTAMRSCSCTCPAV